MQHYYNRRVTCQIKMVNIIVAGFADFPCPANWTVEQARIRIRSMYGLLFGGVLRDGQAMAGEDLIAEDRSKYEFVNFERGEYSRSLFYDSSISKLSLIIY